MAPTISERVTAERLAGGAHAHGPPGDTRQEAGQQQRADETQLGERLQLDRVGLLESSVVARCW